MRSLKTTNPSTSSGAMGRLNERNPWIFADGALVGFPAITELIERVIFQKDIHFENALMC